MYLNVKVATPAKGNGISHKPIKGTKYVYYEHGRRYDPKKGYTVPQTSSIGKICADDSSMMFPNSNYLKYFPEAEFPKELPISVRSGCIKIGDYLVIKKIIEYYKLDNEISSIIGKDAGLFLDLASYAIVSEDNAAQYYPDYAFNHPLFTDGMKIFSDSKISSFLRDISRDDSIQFLNEWNESRDHREKIYISYDSTNNHCQAGDIEIAEFGHELPLFYETYPGSVNDVSQLQFMLEKAAAFEYKNAGFILDRGCFSEPNIRRDASEKLFRGDKSYLGERSMRTYHDEPTHAKIFIEFIALIIRNKIYTCLKDRMKELKKKKNYMTVPAALKELDKIEIIRQMDGVYRLDHAVTATQKDILQAFNMTEATVKKEAGILGEQLRSVTN